jgi:hypothetical protein
MMLTSLEPSQLAVAILEPGLLAGWGAVAVLMARTRVNGPCRLCMGMLLVWRGAVLLNLKCEAPCWDYLWGVVFAYCFLYAIHHLAHAMGARAVCGHAVVAAVEVPPAQSGGPVGPAVSTRALGPEPPQFTLKGLLPAAGPSHQTAAGQASGATPCRRPACRSVAR